MDKQGVPTIRFNPQPIKLGDQWYIIAAYPSDKEERILGVSKEWRRRRGYPDE